jgi:hypothetical protein
MGHQNRVLTTGDIRHFIMDRKVEDNALENDLQFSDEEILQAMDRCRIHYNSLAPISIAISETQPLPSTNFSFFHGTVYHLSLALLSKMTRNEVEFSAGGVQVSLDRTMIKYMGEQLPLHRDEFLGMAKSYKSTLSHRQAMGPVY